MPYKKHATSLSQIRQWFNGVRRYDSYAYGRLEFHLPKDKSDNLQKSAKLALSFRQAYLAQYQKSQTRVAGLYHDVQQAALMVLREFDRVCQARGFVYMLYGGALLGAWRHGEMIPWDDDIDIIMPREQYEKIINVFNAESANPSLRAKLVSPSRGFVFIKIEAVGESAVCIDIFPCDCYADTLDKPLRRYQENVYRRLTSQVFPDKNPTATSAHYTTFRNSFGLTPVAHDNPERRFVVCAADCMGGSFFNADAVFPPGRADFNDLSIPVPADPAAILTVLYGKWHMSFPAHIRSHIQNGTMTTARMLNVKRFLRSDPLHPPRVPIPSRANATETWRDRLITLVRKAAAPVFNVITHDTMKEYRIFSRKVFRLRADRVIRGHLEAIESYSRLIQDTKTFPRAQGEARQSQLESVDILAQVLRVCDAEGLTPWLWRGSLLGALRDEAFLHTEAHAFLLMRRADYERFFTLFNAASDTGGVQAWRGMAHGGVLTGVGKEGGKGRAWIIPCDSCPDDWDRNLYATHAANAESKAAIAELTAKKDAEGLYRHFAALRERMGIGLERDASHSLFPAWDCPALFGQSHVLAAKYYAPSAKRMFEGLEVLPGSTGFPRGT